jgi:hypothetical protein
LFDPSDGEYAEALDPRSADARLIAAAPDLLAALQACDEAIIYMSEYDIPIMLPAQVKVDKNFVHVVS